MQPLVRNLVSVITNAATKIELVIIQLAVQIINLMMLLFLRNISSGLRRAFISFSAVLSVAFVPRDYLQNLNDAESV